MFFDRNKPDKARQNHSEDSLAALIEGLRRQLAGDYQHRVAIADRSDPLWEAADLLNSLAGHNCRVLKEAAHVINEVVYLGVGSGDDLNQLAKSFAVVNENLRQVTDAVDQLSHSVTGLAESVTKTTEQTIVGRDSMGVAKESVNTVSRETEKSKDQLAGLTGNVGEMHDSMSKIDSLVTVVKGVSDQTNLLALNAAIEAARAGEHGRGFAVVAEEVRKLADQSRGSVDEITNQLGNIRASVNNINRAFQDMAAAFNNNLQAVEVADDRVEGLNEVFDNIGRSVESLAPIAEQQSATFEEVNATLREVSGTTDKLNETTQHCNQGVMTLLDETNALRLKFAAMNLGFDAGEIIDLAKTDHMLWLTNINYMLRGLKRLDAGNVSNHHLCRLGKWYFADETQQKYGAVSLFREMDGLHAKFHQTCARAIECYQRGDRGGGGSTG